MTTPEERIATLEGVTCDLRDYMKEGREWREKTTECLAKMSVNQDNFRVYQIHCDADRADIIAKNTALDKRVTETEGYQKRQYKMAGLLAVVTSGLGLSSPKIVQMITEWLS